MVLALALAAELERRGAFDRAFLDAWVEGLDAYMGEARGHSVDEALTVCGITRPSFDRLADLYAGAKRLALSVGT